MGRKAATPHQSLTLRAAFGALPLPKVFFWLCRLLSGVYVCWGGGERALRSLPLLCLHPLWRILGSLHEGGHWLLELLFLADSFPSPRQRQLAPGTLRIVTVSCPSCRAPELRCSADPCFLPPWVLLAVRHLSSPGNPRVSC